MEHCENCGAVIGNLETPNLWQEHVVCAECYARLALPVVEPVEPLTYQAKAEYVPDEPATTLGELAEAAHAVPSTTHYRMRRGDIICPNPNCRYVGPPEKVARGSTVVFLVLLLMMVLPGLIYGILYTGYHLVCPRCRMKVGEAGI